MAAKIASKALRFLTTAQIQRLHTTQINPNPLLSQPNLLESAVHSPRNIEYYTNQDNVFQLAAALSVSIMKNHAYQDGNKRTALVAADMFLKINGYILQKVPLQANSTNDCVIQQLADAHVAVCTNAWTAEQLGQLYQSMATATEEWGADVETYRDAAIEY